MSRGVPRGKQIRFLYGTPSVYTDIDNVFWGDFVSGSQNKQTRKGCIFAAIPVGIFQGAITLFARAVQPVMTDQALSNLSLTGSMLIFCVGVNLIWEKKFKVANVLPAIVIAVVCAFAYIQ